MSYGQSNSGGEMVVGLSLEDSMSQALSAASQNLIAFGGNAERALGALGRMAPAAAGILAVGVAMKTSVSAAAELQQQTANLNAVLNTTPAQMQKITASSMELSRQTQFTTAQILAAQTQLAKAGSNPQQVMQQAPDVLNLASATFSDPTLAAKAYVAAQKDFNLGTGQSTAMVNDLAKAVDSSTGTLTTFMNSYKQIGPVAQSANISMHDTNVVLADLMNAGLADQSGTAFKTFIQRIQHETPAAKKAADDLNLSFYDQYGQMKSVAEIADQLRMKTAALSDEQKNAALYTIFGARGVRVADIFSEEGAQGLTDTAQHMAGLADASGIAQAKLDTLQGQMHILASSMNVLAVQGGNAILPMFKSLTEGANAFAKSLSFLGGASPVAPSLILGGLAVGAEANFARKRSNAKANGADTPDPAVAAAKAGRDAQIKNDLDISASHRSVEEQMAAEDAKYTALYQANIDKQIQSVHDLMAAEVERQALAAKMSQLNDEKALAAQSVQQQYAHDRMDLLANQNAARDGRVGTGASPQEHAFLTERQALATEEKEAIQASNADFLPQYEALADERVRGQIAAEEKASKTLLTGLDAAHAERIAAITAGSEAEIAASQAALGKQLFAADAIAAGGGANVKVAASTIAADTGMVAGIKGTVAGLGAKLGPLVMPVIIALTAEQLIVQPLFDAINKKLASGVIGKPFDNSLISSDPQTGIADAQRIIADKQAKVDAAQKELDSRATRNPFQRVWNTFAAGPGGEGLGEDKNIISQGKADIAAAQAEQAKLRAAQQASPETAITAAQAQLDNLTKDVSSGKTTLIDAEAAWKGYGQEVGEGTAQALLAAGNSQAKTSEIMAGGIKSLENGGKAYQQTVADNNASLLTLMGTYQQNLSDFRDAQAKGATDQVATGAIFDQDMAGNKIDPASKAADVKALAELTTAWKDAETAIGKVDLSKGLAGIVSAAPDLKKATDALAKFGVTDTQLTSLNTLSQQFKTIKDGEDAARAALEGYQLTLTQTNQSITEIGSLKSEFLAALSAAEDRQSRGTADQSDLDIINSADSVLGSLDKTTGHLQQNANRDILGKLSNLPDYEKLDQVTRDTVDRLGGGKQIVMDVKAETTQALQDILAVENGKYTADLWMNVHYAYPNGGAPPPPPDVPDGVDYGYGNTNFMPTNTGGNQGASTPTDGGVTVNPAASPLGYKPLSDADYLSIVKSSEMGKSNGPFEDPQVRDALMKAAQEGNVDPRALLAFTKWENHDAVDISPDLNRANNFGGIKYDPSNPNETRGPVSSEGDNYAAFASPEAFFAELAKNLSTGQYAQDFQQGNLTGIASRYVAGSAQPNYDQSVGIQGRTGDYWDWVQRYGPPGNYSTSARDNGSTGQVGGGPNGNGTFSPAGVGGVATGAEGGGATGTQIDSVRQQIVNKALASLDTDTLAGYCEQFVEQTVQAITGQRGSGVKQASGNNPADANQAFALAQKANLVTQNPQKGDLVYYTDNAAGHVAIYMGDGLEVSTADSGEGGVVQGQKNLVHVEKVGAGAQYVSIAGSSGAGVPDDLSGSVYPGENSNAPVGTKSAVGTDNKPNAPIYRDVSLDADRNRQLLSNADPQTISDAGKIFTTALPIMQKLAADTFHNGAGPQTQPERDQANQLGGQGALKVDNAVAQYLLDAKNHTGDIDKDMKDIVSLGGAAGPVFGAMAVNMANVAAATAKQKQDQADLVTMNQQWTLTQANNAKADKQTAEDRRVADLKTQQAATATTRKDTTDDWKIQDARQKDQDAWKITRDNIAIATQMESDAWQQKQYHYQDEITQIDRTGTLTQRKIADEKTALDRNYQAQVGQTKAGEQLLLAQSRYANATGGPGSGNSAAVQLAVMHSGDTTRQDSYAKATQDLQDAGLAANRLAEDEKFNAQTQNTLDSRAHDTVLRNLRDEQTAEQKIEDGKQQGWAAADKATTRQRTLDQWKAEDERLQTEQTRIAIDANTADIRAKAQLAHDNDVANLNDTITKDGALLTGYQQIGTALSGVLTQLQTGVTLFGQSANGIAAIAQQYSQPSASQSSALYQQQTAGLTTGSGAFYNQFPQPGAGQGGYAGGTENATPGYHEVAEHGPELLFKGGERVVSTERLSALLNPANVTPISAAPSWTGDVNINITGAAPDALAQQRIAAYVKQEIKASEARNNPDNQRRANGGMR